MSLELKTNNPAIDSGEFEGFRYEIYDSNRTTAMVKIFIPDGQFIKAIPGCMFATSANIEIQGKMKKTMRAMVGPDSARHQKMTAKDGPGWVVLSPGFYGSILPLTITDDQDICVGDDAFLASVGNIESSAQSQGLKKAMFSGHGMYVKHVTGNGLVFVCAVGSMATFTLAEEESMIVDTGHLVTWPSGMKYEIRKASKGWFGTGLSGEGMVSKMTGPAEINVQTRNPEELAEWVYDTKPPPPS